MKRLEITDAEGNIATLEFWHHQTAFALCRYINERSIGGKAELLDGEPLKESRNRS